MQCATYCILLRTNQTKCKSRNVFKEIKVVRYCLEFEIPIPHYALIKKVVKSEAVRMIKDICCASVNDTHENKLGY